jgi:hypothetical protein
MNLSKKSVDAVDAAARGALPTNISAQEGPCSLTVEVETADTIGVSFSRIDFTCADLADADLAELEAWGERLSRKVNYLLEPLVVLEVDSVGGEVDVRSQKPTIRDGVKSYYEIRIKDGGTLSFQRVSFNPETKNHLPSSCQLTREAFERLVEDFAATSTAV